MADDIFVSNDIQLDVDFGEIFVIDQGIVTKVVAKKYDPTKTYVVGEYVIYQEKLYKCNTAIEEPEEFDAEKWNNVLLADEVQIANANIALKANASDVYAKSETYNKTEINTALASKADANTTYSKTEVDTALASKADTATTYTKTEVDTALGDKADKSDTYTKTEVDTALSAKANSDDVYAKTDTYSKDEIDTDIYKKTETYNKNEVDGIINNLPTPMIFKGTLGVNGTITALPTASADNEGYTYKVITDGTYASISAKVGDMFTSNGTAWIHIPSGDETFTDTWRSIKVNGTEKLSGSITSGSVDFKNGTNSTAVFDPSDNSIKVNVDGYTQAQIDTKLAAKANQADVTTALNNKADKSTTYTKTEVNTALALKADKSTTYTKTEVDNLVNLIGTVSGDICTFETTLAEPYQSVTVNVVATGGNGTPQNPIPINGYTEANITRCGVNLLGGEVFADLIVAKFPHAVKNTANKTIRYEGQYVQNIALFDKFKTNTQYTFFIKKASGYANLKIIYTDKTTEQITTYPQTSANNKSILNLSGEWQSGTSVVSYDESGIMEGVKTAADFIPYMGNTYAIAFGQTVYGGVLDVTRGKLHVTKIGVTYDGSADENWTMHGSGSASAFAMRSGIVIDNININAIPMANYLLGISRSATWGDYDNWVSVTADKQIVTGIQSITDVDIWKTYLSNNPLQVVYELATPFDIDLTPEVISAVVGTNNVFADCGQTTVSYLNSNAEDTVTVVTNVIGTMRKDIVGTLTAGQTSITFQDSAITTNSTIEIFVNDAFYGVNPTLVTLANESVILVFEEQATDMPVKVRIT